MSALCQKRTLSPVTRMSTNGQQKFLPEVSTVLCSEMVATEDAASRAAGEETRE